MYNRYVAQPDGSFRRTKMRDNISHPGPKSPPPPKPCADIPTEENPPCQENPRHSQPRTRQSGNVKGFFQNLLPKDFDTADLLIVLLLLLMSGDCQEDQNTALLTLALYFIM